MESKLAFDVATHRHELSVVIDHFEWSLTCHFWWPTSRCFYTVAFTQMNGPHTVVDTTMGYSNDAVPKQVQITAMKLLTEAGWNTSDVDDVSSALGELLQKRFDNPLNMEN